MSFKLEATISKWNGKAITDALDKERDEALPKIGMLGVQQMRSNITFTNRTGRTRDSVMWITHNKKSSMGGRAQPGDAITAPRSRRSVFIGAGARAGEEYLRKHTGSGIGIGVETGRWAHVVALEFGTIKTRAYPFVKRTIGQIKGAAQEIFRVGSKRVIDSIK